MERVVLDTNVLVSALLNSFGAPGRVLDVVLTGELSMAYDDRVLAEWRQVLGRQKFGFSAGDVEVLLGFVEGEGISVNASPFATELADQDDLPFLEVAHAAEATLITGNTRHYPPEARRGVAVLDPTSFLDEWTSKVLQQE